MAETDRALIKVELAPLVPTETAHNRLAEIRQFVKEELKEGIDQDFAVIPGTGKKPSLLQPGAEKLIEKLGLAPTFPIKEWVFEDHGRGEYMVDVLCRLVNLYTGLTQAECWGSAGRSAQEEVDESNAKAREYAAKDGKPSPEPKPLRFSHKGLARNTALKMAQKSGLVGATLKAARLAVDFTQDVEDFGRGGGTPAAQTSAQAGPGGEHWCPEHKVEWFMRGKMKSFAHPVDGQKDWCYEPAKKVTGEVILPKPEPKPGVDMAEVFDLGKAAEPEPGTPEDLKAEVEVILVLLHEAGISMEQCQAAMAKRPEFKGITDPWKLNPEQRRKLKRLIEDAKTVKAAAEAAAKARE